MNRTIVPIALGLVISLVCTAPSRALVADSFGMGSYAAALARAVAASPRGRDPFAASANPAAAIPPLGKRLQIGIGLLYMKPDFRPIDSIVLENSATSDKTGSDVTIGSVQQDYLPVFGQLLGLQALLFPEFARLSFGISLYTPIERSSYFDSGETLIPEYALYRSRFQRPSLESALAGQITEALSISVGMRTGFSVTTKVSSFLATSPQKSSQIRVSSSLTPQMAPYAGILLDAPHDSESFFHRVRLGLIVRGPLRSNLKIISTSKGEVFAGAGSPDIDFESSSVILYDPTTIEWGASWTPQPAWTSFFQLDYQKWDAYESPALKIQGKDAGLKVVGSQVGQPTFRNILIPKIGQEWSFGPDLSRHLRFGYSYRPSILDSLPEGSGNLLDPPSHDLSTGLGWGFRRIFDWETPWSLDLHLAYRLLVSEEIKKSPGGEFGQNDQVAKVGSPGYSTGGRVWGGGITVKIDL